MKTTKNQIKWLSEPEKQDYPSALSFLSLIFDETDANLFVNKLKKQLSFFIKQKTFLEQAPYPF